MGEGWLGPSVEPRGFEAAAGSVGATPPNPPSLPSWGLRPRSCSAWWLLEQEVSLAHVLIWGITGQN